MRQKSCEGHLKMILLRERCKVISRARSWIVNAANIRSDRDYCEIVGLQDQFVRSVMEIALEECMKQRMRT